MDWNAAYAEKRVSPEGFAARVEPGDLVQLGVWYGQPPRAIAALADRAREFPPDKPLRVASNFSTGPWAYLTLPGVQNVSGFLSPFDRLALSKGAEISFCPINYTDCRKWARELPAPDFFVFRTAPMDERGYFNLSLTGSWEENALHWIARERPETRIVLEANPNMPRVRGRSEFGNHELHVSLVHAVLEDDAPLADYPTPAPNEVERAIAANVATLVEDGATTQLGYGNIPMAIGSLIADRRGLGIHSEMLCEAHVDLIEAGAVTNANKGLYDNASVASFVIGEKRLRDFCRDNPEVLVLPIEAVNSVPQLARIRKLTSVNSVLSVDLTGQACAHCLGSKTYSGVGGAFEFAYGAQLSEGGKSVVCMPSTATLKDGRVVSNVVAEFGAGTRITLPEHTTDWVVTEHGAVRIKLMSLEQRAKALISIAHPDFRDDLARAAEAKGLRMARLSVLPPAPAEFFRKGTPT